MWSTRRTRNFSMWTSSPTRNCWRLARSGRSTLCVRRGVLLVFKTRPRCRILLLNGTNIIIYKSSINKWHMFRFKYCRNIVKPQYYAVEKATKRAQGILNSREKQAAADQLRTYAQKERKSATKGDRFTKDVWTVGSLKDQRTDFKGQWIDRNVSEHNLCNTGTPVAGVPKSAFHKRSQLKYTCNTSCVSQHMFDSIHYFLVLFRCRIRAPRTIRR